MNKRKILVFRDQILPPSETFIISQSIFMHNIESYFLGSKRVDNGLKVDSKRCFIINNGTYLGRMSEILFKKFEIPPYSLMRRLRKLQPDLIHAHFGIDGVYALPFKKKLNIPLVVTFHGYDATIKDEVAKKSFYGHRNYLKKRERLKKEADLFIAVSDFIKSKLLDQGFPPRKIIKHYIGIDTNFFKAQSNIKREAIVLFVGRLVEKKGCEYLIRAMNIVRKAHPEVKLVVIGDGPLRKSLQKMAENFGLNCKFLGVQSQDIIKMWMNKAKVFCVPSVTSVTGDAEGFGLVFIEAQSMGLPVVSFASGGIPEAVKHGSTGFLAPEKDFEKLASYISRFFEDEELWRQFSENGRKRVVENFNLHKQNILLTEIYHEHFFNKGK